MTSVEVHIHQRAAARNATVVLPDSADSRVQEAAAIIQATGMAKPVLVDDSTQVDGTELMKHLLSRRREKGLSEQEAARLASLPLYKAAWLVHTGMAQAGVAGSLSTTADVLRAGLWTIGQAENIHAVSSFFLMTHDNGQQFTYADCGVIPDPTSEQLAEIAWLAATNHRLLTGVEPRVAFLSFSTKGSAEHLRVEKVRTAYALFAEAHPDVVADGEVQLDTAIVPMVAHRKAPDSRLAGMANVLIFPDLDSGNIAYKLTERLAGFKAYGPIVQGLRKPFVDLSRGCTTHDIVTAAAIAILQAP